MVVNGLTLNASSYQNFVKGASGTLSVPVKPSNVIYSQLSYIHGTAADSGQNGVPLNKIRILNTLIEQLVTMKSKPNVSYSDVLELNDNQKDALIQTIQKEISTTIAQSTYGLAGLMPEAGALFSINA